MVNTYAQEYQLMMKELLKVVRGFKGYNGSREHMKKLDDCIEKGKNVLNQRGVLTEKTVQQSFGVVREMIIKRQKAKSTILYLEKCIAKEKEFIASLELEEQTIQMMQNIVSSYESKCSGVDELCDEAWESLIKETSEASQELLSKLDHNQVSYSIHHDQITEAFKVILNSIEEENKKERK